MGTRSELDYWGAAHRSLSEKLRRSDRRGEVFAMAWEQHLLDRPGRRFELWSARDMNEGEKGVLMLARPSMRPIGTPSHAMEASTPP